MENAYMIRNDGNAIPVVQHLYGNIDEVTETLYAGEWLYEHTRYEKTKQLFINLIASYARFYEGLESSKSLISDLKAIITGYPYKYLSTGFVDAHAKEIQKAFDQLEMSSGKSLMQSQMQEIIDELNQEFLRARYGGLYNTKSSSREMVFRVSSTDFNWYNIIWQFVYDHEKVIDSVTIVRDEESTGVINGFYRSKSGQEYNQYPTQDFIMEKGSPVIETRDMVKDFLSRAVGPLSELKELPINADRIKYRLKALRCQENKDRRFYEVVWDNN